MNIPTIKVKPWGEGQGDFVIINEADFDPAVHQRFEAEGGHAPAAPGLDPFDHDGDGNPGGSKPKAKRKAKA